MNCFEVTFYVNFCGEFESVYIVHLMLILSECILFCVVMICSDSLFCDAVDPYIGD